MSGYSDLTITRDSDGQTITGDEVFVGLHRAVDALKAESPGGVDVATLSGVIDLCAIAAEALAKARLALRQAKGLPIDPLDAILLEQEAEYGQ